MLLVVVIGVVLCVLVVFLILRLHKTPGQSREDELEFIENDMADQEAEPVTCETPASQLMPQTEVGEQEVAVPSVSVAQEVARSSLAEALERRTAVPIPHDWACFRSRQLLFDVWYPSGWALDTPEQLLTSAKVMC